MKYNGMPAGMWMLFKNSFRKALTGDLGYSLSLSMDRRPTVNEAIRYYEHAMTNPATKKFCRMGGEKKFTDSDIEFCQGIYAGIRRPYCDCGYKKKQA